MQRQREQGVYKPVYIGSQFWFLEYDGRCTDHGFFVVILIPLFVLILPVFVDVSHAILVICDGPATFLAAHPLEVMIDGQATFDHQENGCVDCNCKKNNIAIIVCPIFPRDNIDIYENKCEHCVGE